MAFTGAGNAVLPLVVLIVITFHGPVHAMPGAEPLVWPVYREPGSTNRPCPCSHPQLCNPVTTVAKTEGFAFMTSGSNYKKYDWTKITTIILFLKDGIDEVMCYAHNKGVRVSYGVDFPLNSLINATARTSWVKQQVAHAQYYFLDGVNFDFESPIAASDTARRDGLNSLVTELTKAFKSMFVNPQITFDTPNNPYTGRRYDYIHIATTMDFLLIMAYDESGGCTAGANANFVTTSTGAKKFIALGISPQRLVLGLPWYGYDYPCSSISQANNCIVSPRCGGGQVGYSGIMESLFNTSISGRLWDNTSVTPFFNRKDSKGVLHQTWYDDKESLGIKYGWATSNKLRGVGIWHADCLDYADTPEAAKQRQDMWGAMPVVNTPPSKINDIVKNRRYNKYVK